MKREYWVDGMPVYYCPRDVAGVAKGITNDDKFIFETNTGETYYLKSSDPFSIMYETNKDNITEACNDMNGTICPYNRIIDNYSCRYINKEQATKAILETKIPDGVKPDSPAAEYFNKYRDSFIGLMNAYSEKHKNIKDFIVSVCGDNWKEVGKSTWDTKYIKKICSKVLVDLGYDKDDVNRIGPMYQKFICYAYLTFGDVKRVATEQEAKKISQNNRKKGMYSNIFTLNGDYIVSSYINVIDDDKAVFGF